MKPRKIFIVPPEPPTQKPPQKVTAAEIDRVMREHERSLQALKDFRKPRSK